MALLKCCRPYPYVNHLTGGIPQIILYLGELDAKLMTYGTDELVSFQIELVRSKIEKHKSEMILKWNLCLVDMRQVCETKLVPFDEENPPSDWRVIAKYYQGAVWSDPKCEHGRVRYYCNQCGGK